MKMIIIFWVENDITISSVFDIIIYKICHLQKSSLVILLNISKNSKLYYYYNILLICLSVSLKVKHDQYFIFIYYKNGKVINRT